MNVSRADSRGLPPVTGFVCGLPAHMTLGSGIRKELGAIMSWAIGREGRVQKVGLGGLSKGQWGGRN